MDATTLILFLLGFGLLIFGADLLVRGAAGLAAAFGISPLVIGLTVVSFGTSAPEFAVSLGSAMAGQVDLALGNVVGSNICNTLLILGVAAVIAPLRVSSQVVRREVPIMIGISALVCVFAINGGIGRIEGTLMFLALIAYTAFTVISSRRETAAAQAILDPETAELAVPGKPLLRTLQVLIGLALLVLGADWLVDGAVVLARTLGVSELIIGLTVIAIGTSLPEVAATVAAALKGERDMAVGNVVGSNVFNLLGVLGLTAAVSPGGVPVGLQAMSFDMPVMLATAVACLPVFLNGHRIERWEGGLFLSYYVAYLLYLVLLSMGSSLMSPFTVAMVYFVMPLTVVTFAVVLTRKARGESGLSG